MWLQTHRLVFSAPVCPVGWNSSSSNPQICYQMVTQSSSWMSAMSYCRQLNSSTLPIFYNKTEFDDYYFTTLSEQAQKYIANDLLLLRLFIELLQITVILQ